MKIFPSRDSRPIFLGLALLASAAGAVALSRRRRAARFPLRGKVVVITGGSRGLGLALAEECARQGARLALIARDEAELRRAAEAVQRLGADVAIWMGDVRDPDELARVIDDVKELFGGIDVLVNNAGEIVVAPLEVTERSDFEAAMAIHFTAPLAAMEAARPYLEQRGESRVVNIASFGGKVAVPHLASYCASKFALVGLSDAIRSEWAAKGIRVTTVCPGLMRTGSHFNAFFKGDARREFTWFSLGLATPFLSIGAGRAARQIVAAMRRGDAELTITWAARAAVAAQGLFPGLVGRAMKVVAGLLPAATENRVARRGWQSQPRAIPDAFLRRADAPAARWNEGHARNGNGSHESRS